MTHHVANRLAVYQTRAAQPALAGWLERLLVPLSSACRFDRLPPIEIRPTGRWGGWCAGRDDAPDRRVCLSSRISFWTTENVIAVYLHEACHRVLDGQKIDGHGPEFFALNSALLIRAGSFFRCVDGFQRPSLYELSLYDFQDCPEALADEPGWRGIVLEWGLAVAAELAASELAAEALPEVICGRWNQYLVAREEARKTAVAKARRAARITAQQLGDIARLKASRRLLAGLCSVGWLSFVSVCFLVFN